MFSPKREATFSIPSEGDFLKAFMRMQTMVKELYQDRKKGERGSPSHVEVKKEGGGEEPSKTPPSSSSYLDGSMPFSFEKQKTKIDFNVPQLKLDINFQLAMYNGELNVEKFDN